MRRMLATFALPLVVALSVAIGVPSAHAQPDTRAADEKAIRETDLAWSKTAEARDLERLLSFFAEGASELGPNAPIAVGKDALRKAWAGYFATPGFSISWKPTTVEAARSGDLGYSIGTYQMTVNDAKGKPVTDHGKYVTIWRKQADGSWKVFADIFNSDLPAPAMH